MTDGAGVGAIQDFRIALVASQFNRFIVDQLVAGARDALERQRRLQLRRF